MTITPQPPRLPSAAPALGPTSMPLDPAIARLCPLASPPSPIDWLALEDATGCSRERYFAALASAQLLGAHRALAGYRSRPAAARRVRHLAICEGVVKAPRRRSTAEERALAEARRWGLAS